FHFQEKPFDIGGKSWKAITTTAKKGFYAENTSSLTRQVEVVKQLLINLYLGDSDQKWDHLCYPIGRLCLRLFPNMEPKQSVIIVHRAGRRFFYQQMLNLPIK